MGPWCQNFPPQTRPYLKMAIPCFLELEEVAAKSFSVLWGGKGLRKCVSSGAGAFHSSAQHTFLTQALSTNGHFQDCLQNVASGAPNGQFTTVALKCVFYTNFTNERPLPTKMCLCYRNFINERQLPGLSPKCRFWSSKWPALYI